jgi:DNA-binding FrmR family transcriptional regulator
MKIFKKLVLFFSLLLIAPIGLAGGDFSYFCWKNNAGVKECGNSVPPQYSQNGFEICKIGGACEYVPPAPTAEEIAELERKKELEIQRKKQEKKDQALLALYSTESDIEDARAALLNTVEGQIQSIKTILDGLKANHEDLKKSYQFSEKNSDVSEQQLSAIQRNIDSIQKRIEDTEETLQSKQNEKDEINRQYDAYVQHFRDIQRRRGVSSK